MAEYRLNTGYSLQRAIDYNGDRDSFQTTLINGLTYSFKVSGAYSGGGTLADPNLTLQITGGSVLRFNDDIVKGVNRDAQITFKAGATGNYDLVVGEQGNNANGTYTLILSNGYGTNNADRVTGTAYNDGINGMGGNDIINGAGGNDRLYGGDGADQLLGGIGNDFLSGDAGNDVLRGGDGADRLNGGSGADRLIGGKGADVFDFDFTSDSRTGGIDVIAAGDGAVAFEGAGRAGGDVFDVRTIDANANIAGNQAFVWSSSKAAGTAYLAESNGNTVFYAHTNNDGMPDLTVIIADGAIRATDYISSDFLL